MMTFNTTLKMDVMSTYVLRYISDSETKTGLVTHGLVHGLVSNVPVNVKEKYVKLLGFVLTMQQHHYWTMDFSDIKISICNYKNLLSKMSF